MIRKNTVYSLAMFAWALVSGVTVILVYSGNAEPYVSASQAPGGRPVAFGTIVGSWILGALVVDRLRTRDWKVAGRAVGLEPQGTGLLGKPEMTGRVDGRQVRARTRKKKTSGGGGESGSSKSTFTVVEADLAGPSDRGLMMGAGAAGAAGEYEEAGIEVTVVDGVGAVGCDEAFLRDMLDARARDAVGALSEDDTLLVGDAGGMLQQALEEMTDSRIGNMFARIADRATDKMAGDAATVSLESKGLVLDPDRMERQVEAVVAVADAFEHATDERA